MKASGNSKHAKVRRQSASSNMSQGGKIGNKAGKKAGGKKSSRKGVPNGSRKERDYSMAGEGKTNKKNTKDRAERNRARKSLGLKKGDKKQAGHVTPLKNKRKK